MKTIPKLVIWIAVVYTLLLCIAEPSIAIAEGSDTEAEEVFTLDEIRFELVMIVHLDFENDTVTVINGNGYVFKFKDVDDWFVGDYAIVVYNKMGTPIVFDDRIISIYFQRPDLVEEFGLEFIRNDSGSEIEPVS